jgi:hypothetical protein
LHFRVKLVPRYDKVYLIVEEEDEITLWSEITHFRQSLDRAISAVFTFSI